MWSCSTLILDALLDAWDIVISLTSLQQEFFPHFFVEMWVFTFLHALLEFRTVYMSSNYEDVINLNIDLWLKSTTTRCLGMPSSMVLLWLWIVQGNKQRIAVWKHYCLKWNHSTLKPCIIFMVMKTRGHYISFPHSFRITVMPPLSLTLTSPPSDLIKPTTVTRKQTKLNVPSTIHFLVQAPILFCTKYISTGKYMVKGQNFKAPNSPKTESKYGKSIAIPVVDITYAIRKHSLRRFNWKPGNSGSLKM